MECNGRSAHIKLICISFVCVLLYVYLYANATLQTIQIERALSGTLEDIAEWKKEIGKIIDNVSGEGNLGNHASIQNVLRKEQPVPKTPLCTNKSNPVRNCRGREALTEPIITLFTSWVTKPEKYMCHNLTLYNWNLLKPHVRPILFTNEEKVKKEAIEKGWTVLPVRVTGTPLKVPVLRHMYLDAKEISDTTFYAYANGDILFTDTLLFTLREFYNSKMFNLSDPLLIIGQRTNVRDLTMSEAKTFKTLTEIAKLRGSLFTSWGEDYFITSKSYPWDKLADVVIGRVAYDNWMVWNSKRLGYPTIDATRTLLAVHDTTKSGNMEGHTHPQGGYNNNILTKMYKKIKYGAGITSCADYYSNYTVDRKIQFVRRKLSRNCLP